MAIYEGPKVHVTVDLVYVVPADWKFGSPWVEVEKAVAGMLQQLRSFGVLKENEHPSDDLIRVQPRDEEIWVVATIHDVTKTSTPIMLDTLKDLLD